MELKKKYLDELAARAGAKPLAAAPLKGPAVTLYCMHASIRSRPSFPDTPNPTLRHQAWSGTSSRPPAP